ncbi:MAG: PaaI family thioesterase [Planctomycetota bacterium]
MTNIDFSDAPISKLVGFQVEPPAEPGLGLAIVRLECNRRLHNPMGRVHGGVISALADAALGIAFGRTLFDDQDFSTIEMKVNFMRPVIGGTLTARAEVVQRGLRVGFVRCEIKSDRGKLVADGTCTCTVI